MYQECPRERTVQIVTADPQVGDTAAAELTSRAES